MVLILPIPAAPIGGIAAASRAPRRPAPPAFNLDALRPLDMASPVPLHVQLAERLAAPIHAEQAALEGHALPGEIQCARHFGVSRATARQAMLHLTSRGLVARGRGRGTFVAPARRNRDLGLALEAERRDGDQALRFTVLDRREIPAPAAIAARLGLPAGGRVVQVRRLRFVDDAVCAFEQRYLPLPVARHVTAAMLAEMPAVSLLTAALRQSPARITNTLRCRPAAAAIARALGVARDTPLPQAEHTYYAAGGAPLLHGTIWFHDARFLIELDVQSVSQSGPARP